MVIGTVVPKREEEEGGGRYIRKPPTDGKRERKRERGMSGANKKNMLSSSPPLGLGQPRSSVLLADTSVASSAMKHECLALTWLHAMEGEVCTVSSVECVEGGPPISILEYLDRYGPFFEMLEKPEMAMDLAMYFDFFFEPANKDAAARGIREGKNEDNSEEEEEEEEVHWVFRDASAKRDLADILISLSCMEPPSDYEDEGEQNERGRR